MVESTSSPEIHSNKSPRIRRAEIPNKKQGLANVMEFLKNEEAASSSSLGARSDSKSESKSREAADSKHGDKSPRQKDKRKVTKEDDGDKERPGKEMARVEPLSPRAKPHGISAAKKYPSTPAKALSAKVTASTGSDSAGDSGAGSSGA
jgi:hypothetical protein